MNIEESCFERTYHKVQVPTELIHPILFRLKNLIFYFYSTLLVIFLGGFYYEYIFKKQELDISAYFLLVLSFITFSGIFAVEIENRKLISLMKNGILTKGVSVLVKLENSEGEKLYKIKYRYKDLDEDEFFITVKTNTKDLKIVDVLYSTDYPKEDIVINPEFMCNRVNKNEIIELINRYSILIETKTASI